MHGTVLYRPTPAQKLPYGPVCAYHGPTGNIIWLIDDEQMDPVLGHAIKGLGNLVMAMIPIVSPTTVRVHRDHQLGGSELVVADITDTIDIFVPFDLLTAEVARQLSYHGTKVQRAMLRRAHILGQGNPPPAA